MISDKDKFQLTSAVDTGGIISEVRSEATLLKAGALQNAIFNSANFSSIATDAKGVIQIFNVGAERMLGYTADEVMNKITPADISDPQEVISRAKELSFELDTPITPGFEALVFKASRGIEDIYELTYIRKDGSRFPAVVSVTALRDEQDAIIGYLLIGTDNTARKQIEAEKQLLLDIQEETHKQLQEKNVELENARSMAEKTSLAKSDFLANMSHELRTPLNSVIGFSEVLQDQLFGPINEKQQEYVNNILTSGRHLLSLINDILDLSKVESGKMELELNTFSLRESLDSSLMMLREKALKGGIALHLDFTPEADVCIVADQRKLKQILFNLISNAVKFTPMAGIVNVSVVRDGDFIEITVADTGIGIRGEDIQKLFQAFTQLESVYTKGFEGTGLGLALTRQLVELHGGRIWVKSEFGAGSWFSFTIPLTQAASKETPANLPDIIPGSGNTILVIEDDPLTLATLENALQRKGYRALRASSGKEGVEIAQRVSPDLIVLDLLMPGMSGFDVADRLRNVHDAAHVPILVLTSMDLSAADRARLAGKVWRIEGKGSLSTHEFLTLVESAVGAK